MHQDDSTFATAKQVGHMLGVHPKTVLRWAAADTIPCIRMNKRVVRFHVPDVLRRLHVNSPAERA
jgi:predicted site-specific integrase-resolvase